MSFGYYKHGIGVHDPVKRDVDRFALSTAHFVDSTVQMLGIVLAIMRLLCKPPGREAVNVFVLEEAFMAMD